MSIPPNTTQVHKKTVRPEKADNPVIFAFITFLQQNGFTVNLRPVNGVQMAVIETVAA